MKYRYDIEGLRALAVVAVVLFHLDLAWFAGGYVGVDVFFVISGFLITSIVAEKIDRGSFRLLGFYVRRIRRLVPALLATVIATTIGAAALFMPIDLSSYARSAVGAIASLSNLVFFAETGYWDSGTDLKPLLHTWSLGVEEQFYAFWPLLTIAILRIRNRIPVAGSLVALSVAGLGVSLWIHSISPDAAFYMLPARAYQFALGALVGQVSQSWLADRMRGRTGTIVTGIGLTLVVVSVLSFDHTTSFPGIAAVVPTVGTAMAIAGGVGGTSRIIALLLENKLSRWLGRVSYALYLTHWPIISLYRYATGVELGATERLALTVVTLLATVALHLGVERRFYSRNQEAVSRRRSDSKFALRVVAVGLAVAVVMIHPWVGDGWAWRYSSQSLSIEDIEAGMQDRFQLTIAGCTVLRLDDAMVCKMERPIQVLVLGNSHEPDGYNFLVGAYGDREDVNLISFGTTNRCDLRRDEGAWHAQEPECDERLARLFGDLSTRLDVIMYVANRPFAANKATLLSLLVDLKEAQPEVSIVAMGGWINTAVPCARLINETGTSRSCAAPENVVYAAESPQSEPLFEDFIRISDRFVDRRLLLCGSRESLDTCRTETASGVPMSYDEHHQSFEFAFESGQIFAAGGQESLLPEPQG